VKYIQNHSDPSIKGFLKRTVAAQLHLAGTLAAMAGLAVLLHYVSLRGDRSHFWACLYFGLSGIFVFAVSTTYHFMSDGYVLSEKAHVTLENLDHVAIFLFIAGTYTPFLMNVIRPPWQVPLLILIWASGLAGIIYIHLKPRLPQWMQHRFVYTGIFLLTGWTMLIRIGEAVHNMTAHGVALLVTGGLCYSIGALFYALKRPNLIKDVFGFHELWHVMVLLGFGFHYWLILNFYR
jgi:hemolysin III